MKHTQQLLSIFCHNFLTINLQQYVVVLKICLKYVLENKPLQQHYSLPLVLVHA